MGYNEFAMYGSFKFDKSLPKNIIEIFKKMNENYELGSDWYKEQFKNQRIEAEWCPWKYNLEQNTLENMNCFGLNHNYYFIDWLSWIIESVCIPNDIKLNGYGYWKDDNNSYLRDIQPNRRHYGDGDFKVIDNYIKTHGTFFGSDDFKTSIKVTNKIVSPKKVKVKNEKSPNDGKIKGSFCVTGKVSMLRNEFKQLGIDNGFEFKNSITQDLTYLICNDKNSTSSKIKTAKKYGIKILTEEEFKKLFN